MQVFVEELFVSYHKEVYNYLYSLSHDVFLSEDLTSEVFLEVMKSLSTFRGDSDIKTWLFSIARHRWFAYLRKKEHQVKTESLDVLTELNRSEEIQEDPGLLQQIIGELLQSENETTKSVFQLRIEGYSFYEIGKKVKISESSARVIFFRMKTKVKKRLEKEGYSI